MSKVYIMEADLPEIDFDDGEDELVGELYDAYDEDSFVDENDIEADYEDIDGLIDPDAIFDGIGDLYDDDPEDEADGGEEGSYDLSPIL